MKQDTLNSMLDRVRMGDFVEVVRRNQASRPLTSRVEGYALVDSDKGTISLDLLEGDPHAVRSPTGVVWGTVTEVWVKVHREHEDTLMFWTEE